MLDSEVLSGLNSFLTAKQTKTLFVKSNEMSAGSKANAAIRSDVGQYLGVDDFYARMQYATRSPKRVGGFTSVGFEHVVVKVKASQNPSQSRHASRARHRSAYRKARR